MNEQSPDIVKLYNPANAASLTDAQVAGLQQLDSDQIKQLSKAYPNLTMQRAYLLIIDGSKPVHKQLPTLSSFENLWNLRERNGQRKFVAYQFVGTYKARQISAMKPRKTEVLDLSDTELMTLPGFKVKDNGTMLGDFSENQQVKVTKVKRETVQPKEVVVTNLSAEPPTTNYTIKSKP